jgi:hypothetical protein
MNMRKLQFLLFVLVIGSFAAYGQGNVMIQSFDAPPTDTNTVNWTSVETGGPGGNNSITLSADSVDKAEGAAAIKVYSFFQAQHQWGTWTQFGYTLPAGQYWDISGSDSVSIWIKVHKAPTHPEWMVLRVQLVDRPEGTDKEQWIYENATILDGVHDWVNLRVPLFERTTTGTEAPDSTGFITPPSNWGGLTWNNKKFDRNKIVEWSLAVVTSGYDPSNNLPADSIEVSFDGFERFGFRAFPVVFFGGKDWPSYFSTWAWGGSSILIEQNAGTVPNENAIKWTQGDGWTGWGGDIIPPVNMGGAWMKDSLKFKMKCESGVGEIRVQFESAAGKRGSLFTPTTDGAWHDYAFSLRDMVVQDGALDFDSTAVNKFGIMSQGVGVAGKVVYITQLWTGNPEIDVIPPIAPQNVAGIGGGFVNILTWDAVPGEPGVRYNAYFSEHAWTDVADSTVEDLPPYNLSSTLATHILRSPVTDQNVTYYYGATAKDAAGNVSAPGLASSPTTTMAKGVPTISMNPPVTFVADGDLSEWSSITPIDLSVVSGTAHGVPTLPVTNDADLSVKVYLAVDATYLYVAFDVTDDYVKVDTTGANGARYMQDRPDMFIGLYDWRGKHHDGYTTGAKPEYHFCFEQNLLFVDQPGSGDTLMHNGNPNYKWAEKVLTNGYIVESRIPWTEIALAYPSNNDVVFSPKEGMRIPIDFSINDRDDLTNTAASDKRHAIMCYSPNSNDNSWSGMYYWTHTWIGSQWTVGVKNQEQVARVYQLDQNYPNPFNPSTEIRYSVAKAGLVSLKVFDILGREVATLVSSNQEAGSHSVSFNAGQGLASGVYFFRLEAGSFVATHKMMLLK